MTETQIILITILVLGFILFAWGRWRYDVVAMAILLVSVTTGIVPAPSAFEGFGHPAVVTVVCVFILSHALNRSGIVNMMARGLASAPHGKFGNMVALTLIVAVLSSFMNNVGALALMLPVALSVCHRDKMSPSLVLMPMAFASLMGGVLTLIGTPPNIIIANFREEQLGQAFGFFEFTPLGLTVALVGIAFIVFGGYRLTPIRKKTASTPVTEDAETVSYVPALIFAAAIVLTSLRLAPVELTFAGASLFIIALGYLQPGEVYQQVDWAIVVLLGAMIPVGKALETTGAANLIAKGLSSGAEGLPMWGVIALTVVIAMALSNIINNAAAALLMAPIGFDLATAVNGNQDAFLMAVAIGSSCAFIAPIGHQSNLLIMQPGGYWFSDYWRLGLPLSGLVVLVATPVIMLLWPPA